MSQTENTPVMPAVFAGHGSPMNAIESNQFTENWKKLGETIPRPKLIFCITIDRQKSNFAGIYF